MDADYMLGGTMPVIINMEGTPPLTGRALPNLLMQSNVKVKDNAVLILKY